MLFARGLKAWSRVNGMESFGLPMRATKVRDRSSYAGCVAFGVALATDRSALQQLSCATDGLAGPLCTDDRTTVGRPHDLADSRELAVHPPHAHERE